VVVVLVIVVVVVVVVVIIPPPVGEAGFSSVRLRTSVRPCVYNTFASLRRDPCCSSTLVIAPLLPVLL